MKKLTGGHDEMPGSADHDAQAGLASLAKAPFIEAAITTFIGFGLLLLGKTDLAQFTWILGAALSFTRYAFSKTLQAEIEPVKRLATIIDLRRRLPNEQFQQMVSLFLEITEPEFGRVKNGVVSEALRKLDRLAHHKTSDELSTGEYLNWLFPTLQDTQRGSTVWAVSMMLSIEWIESAVEDTFIEYNIAASRRGVTVERIFVVARSEISAMLQNKYIREQYEHVGEHLKLLVVEREYLAQHDPGLLKRLGDGLIAVDDRVALVDISSPEGYRGRVTMSPAEIAELRHQYDTLRVYSRPLASVVDERLATPQALLPESRSGDTEK